jgi:hypothetical protein
MRDCRLIRQGRRRGIIRGRDDDVWGLEIRAQGKGRECIDYKGEELGCKVYDMFQ